MQKPEPIQDLVESSASPSEVPSAASSDVPLDLPADTASDATLDVPSGATLDASSDTPLGRRAVQRTLVVLASSVMLLQIAWHVRTPVSPATAAGDRGEAIVFQTDLEAADWRELALLPGIGPVLARRIIRDRQRRGPVQTLAGLERVPGIGPKRLQEIAPWICPPDEASP